MKTLVFVINLALAVVWLDQRTSSAATSSPPSGGSRTSSLTTGSLTEHVTPNQRQNGVPDCSGLVEEVGDPNRLPPWGMGSMYKGSFISIFRFNTRAQAEACVAGREDFVVRFYDKKTSTWKKP